MKQYLINRKDMLKYFNKKRTERQTKLKALPDTSLIAWKQSLAQSKREENNKKNALKKNQIKIIWK